MRAHPWGLVGAVTIASLLSCGPHARRGATGGDPVARQTFSGSRVRSYTDTFAVTSIADSPTSLFIGTAHGLLRWELGSGKFNILTSHDGLPADRVAALAVDGQGGVWVATAKGLSRGVRSAWSNFPVAPVGEFLTGLQPGLDGRSVWAGGPEGLARLRGGKWERYLPDTGVTALAMAPNGVVWVGTSGKGVLRIPRSYDRIEQYGAAQGCETDVVRGLTITDKGVLAVGDGPAGPRAAYHDGERFFSYRIDAPQVLEWAARAGKDTFIGAGAAAYEVTISDKEGPPSGPVKLAAVTTGQPKPPRTVVLKPELASATLDDPVLAPGAQPVKAKDQPKESGPRAPRFDTVESAFRLPDGVTAVAGSERGLLVGSRFLGSVRIENGVVRTFRASDLVAGAQRLTVACKGDDCYLATGGARAWRFDGQAFEVASIDPEPGSRVLAVLNDRKGEVLAIHRGAKGSELRISSVADGRWTPVSMQSVAVPLGAPELNFAEFSPDGHLWLGLRYVDKAKDPVDHGAAEVDLDAGHVVYHRQGDIDMKTSFGAALPNDMVAMYWRSTKEAWFATRSGAARLLDGKVRVFTENDGMESELIYDIESGPDHEVWVATRHGTGRYDGKRWSFPKMGPFYLPATSLAHDARGHTFLGTEKGVFCVGDCAPDGIDAAHGLLDNSVLDITVDPRGRVWALTAKGVSIIEP